MYINLKPEHETQANDLLDQPSREENFMGRAMCCPVALATKERMGIPCTVRVSNNGNIVINSREEENRFVLDYYRMSKLLTQQVKNFDSEKPIRFGKYRIVKLRIVNTKKNFPL